MFFRNHRQAPHLSLVFAILAAAIAISSCGQNQPVGVAAGAKLTAGSTKADEQICTLKDGEAKTFKGHNLPTTPTNYRISRDSVGSRIQYHLLLNFKFVDRRSSPDANINASMKARARACIAVAEPFLTGPNDERLLIRLTDGPSEAAELPETEISIVEGQPRDSSAIWRADIECPLMIHEIFHHLGLVDEYAELSATQTTAVDLGESDSAKVATLYDCRSTGPSDSLMAFQSVAFLSVSENNQQIECVCPKLAECSEALSKLKGDPGECPIGSKSKVIYSVSRYETDFSGVQSTVQRGTVDADAEKYRLGKLLEEKTIYRFSRTIAPARTSLLLPAQFRSVIHPGCQPLNELYHKCAANAYRTSVEHGGEGCIKDTPSQCNDQSTDWLR